MPPSGKRIESDPAARKAAATKAAAEAAAAKAAASRLGSEWDSWAVDSKASYGGDAGSPDAEVGRDGWVGGWGQCRRRVQASAATVWAAVVAVELPVARGPESCPPNPAPSFPPTRPLVLPQRRSSRLVSRQCKEEEARRQRRLPAQRSRRRRRQPPPPRARWR